MVSEPPAHAMILCFRELGLIFLRLLVDCSDLEISPPTPSLPPITKALCRGIPLAQFQSPMRRSSHSVLAVQINLLQLVEEIQDKLTKGTVECMICYDMVRRSAHVWSCSSCYSIFHLTCIKKWARAPTSIDMSARKNQGFNWRCPGCQFVQLTSSKD